MAKKTIYLPDELAERLDEAGLPLSKVCQVALTEALEEDLSVPAMLERIRIRLDAIEAVMEARSKILIDRMRELGIDPAEVFSAIPLSVGMGSYLRDTP